MSETLKTASSHAHQAKIGASSPVDARLIWFTLAFAVVFVCTSLAIKQTPWPDPNVPPRKFSAAWWFAPLEINAVARLPVVESDLRDIYHLPGTSKLWAVGAGNLILRSEDAGRSWQKGEILSQDVPPAAAARSPMRSSLWLSQAVAQEKMPQKKPEPEENKTQQATPYEQSQKQETVQQSLPSRREAPDSLEEILQKEQAQSNRRIEDQQGPDTSAEKRETTERRSPDSLYATHLNGVFFVDADRGWAVGNAGRILSTNDGGRTWVARNSGSSRDLQDIAFDRNLNGVAVGAGSTILGSQDGGETWAPRTEDMRRFNGEDLNSISLAGANGLRVAGLAIEQLGDAFQNVGKVAQQVQTPAGNRRLGQYYAVQFLDERRGWAVGSFGRIDYTNDGGQNWVSRRDTLTDLLFDVCFVNDSTGWVAGWNGRIYKTTDAGLSWRLLATGVENTIRALTFADENHGWAVGHRGTLLATVDGGQSWFAQTRSADEVAGPYRKLPAPWYYLSWLLVALLLAPGFRRPTPAADDTRYVHESVANVLVSDRPLEIGDPDPLKFKPVAFGLSRFIRNENTVPPLTIAITGKWGSGKSSLMNLLHADLLRHKFQTVWFNAWHHQKEEHLLAALLENVKAQAIPPWYTYENLTFRYRLFRIRLRRNWAGFVALFLLYSAVFGFLLTNPTALSYFREFARAIANNELPTFIQSGVVLAIGTALITSLGLLWRAVRAFGLKPARLMASMSGRFRVRDFTAQAGFRYRFEREFHDVTEALDPFNLIILIDDLDRCRPENVLDVLEAVNFLVASGGCFVVMGLDLERVERCVGLGFKDVAEELLDEQVPESNGANGQRVAETESVAGRRRRAQYARQYLEKLINIEVPVPEPTAEQTIQLLAPQQRQQSPPSSLSWLAAQLVRPAKAVWPVALIAATIGLGAWLGSRKALQWQPESVVSQNIDISESQGSDVSTGDEAGQRVEDFAFVGRVEPGINSDFPAGFLYVPLVVILGIAVWRISIRPETVVKDSKEFRQALEIWHNFIHSKQNTPRAVKRFMNRLRFFAMRLPQEEQSDSVMLRLQKLAGAVPLLRRFVQPEDRDLIQQPGNGRMAESTLVALSALYNFNTGWLEEKTHWKEIRSGTLVSNGLSQFQAKWMEQALQEAIALHKKHFHKWPPSDEEVDELLRLSHGIRVS